MAALYGITIPEQDVEYSAAYAMAMLVWEIVP